MELTESVARDLARLEALWAALDAFVVEQNESTVTRLLEAYKAWRYGD